MHDINEGQAITGTQSKVLALEGALRIVAESYEELRKNVTMLKWLLYVVVTGSIVWDGILLFLLTRG